MKESKNEAVKVLAYVIWQNRCRQGDPEANNSDQNYFKAMKLLYPEELKEVENVTI